MKSKGAITFTRKEILDVLARIRSDRDKIEKALIHMAGNGYFSEHEWIQLRGQSEGMLHAAGRFWDVIEKKDDKD